MVEKLNSMFPFFNIHEFVRSYVRSQNHSSFPGKGKCCCFFPQGPTGHIGDETFSFDMKENECKKEVPPPYLLLSINGAENRYTMKIKPDVGAVIYTQISSLGHR